MLILVTYPNWLLYEVTYLMAGSWVDHLQRFMNFRICHASTILSIENQRVGRLASEQGLEHVPVFLSEKRNICRFIWICHNSRIRSTWQTIPVKTDAFLLSVKTNVRICESEHVRNAVILRTCRHKCQIIGWDRCPGKNMALYFSGPLPSQPTVCCVLDPDQNKCQNSGH